MNSCLYKAKVIHNRLAPKEHRFWYNIFMFYLDLDEIEWLAKKLHLLSLNKFNLFSFRYKDHLQGPKENPDLTKTTREHITDYLKSNGTNIGTGRIMVLTNLCTLGYQFNPVSFYFCHNEIDEPVCAVVEVCNTFKEIKPYYLASDTLTDDTFRLNTKKLFYVSPFIDMDTFFDFDLKIPQQRLKIKIDDYDKLGNRFFISTLSGQKKKLSDLNLLLFFLSFPFITLKIISLIHWQAFKLFLKKIPFHKKTDQQDLQQEVYRPYKSS